MATDIMDPFLDDEDELDSRLVDDEGTPESDVEATTERRPWERDYTDEERADMAARRAAGELLLGHKRASTYRRRDITDRDLQLLAFIARFKYATEAQLAMLSNVQPKTAYKRMMGLQELGMAACEHVPGTNRVWFATAKALRWLAEAHCINLADVTELRGVAIGSLGHTLAVNQTALWLMRGYPVGDGSSPLRMPYSLDSLVSEYMIRSAWGALKGARMDDVRKTDEGYVGAARHDAVWRAVEAGKVAPTDAHRREPSLWTIAVKNAKSKQSHQPVLVVNLEALREGRKPVSIAFEIELTAKNRGETASILRLFKEDETRYAQIVWVVQSNEVRKHIIEEDEGIGMTKSGRMKVVPLLGVDGEPFTAPAWRL